VIVVIFSYFPLSFSFKRYLERLEIKR